MFIGKLSGLCLIVAFNIFNWSFKKKSLELNPGKIIQNNNF